MTSRLLLRILGVYFAVLVLACVTVRSCVTLEIDPAKRGEVVATVWQRGVPIDRAVLASPTDHDAHLDQSLTKAGAQLVYETVVAEGPILTSTEVAFSISLVPARDGVKATLGGKTAYMTPDELLARQGYDKGISVPQLGLLLGADVPLILAMLAERLNTTVPKVLKDAKLRRIRVERSVPSTPNAPPPPLRVTPANLSTDMVREVTLEAARYLARGVGEDGRFRYMVDAPTNKTLGGYDWPRHAGAVYFLAQAAALGHDSEIGAACLRAASLLRNEALSHCAMTSCIGTDDVVEVGSSALATIAFVEIVQTGLDPSYAPIVTELAHFLRAQQRADGEFMHEFDRKASKAIDVQFIYFSGEVTLALARAYRLTNNPADLAASARGLAHLVGPAWSFFGNRYYFGEEHWTCQATFDLWDKSPDRAALDFCLRWQAYGRRMQYAEGETSFDADGAFGVGPVVTPRLTPVASRCEAGIATLAAARRAGIPSAELVALDAQLRRSLALLIRNQLNGISSTGLTHLLADPAAVRGAMPGSAVDWELRIDYAQHAGSAMIRWLELMSPETAL